MKWIKVLLCLCVHYASFAQAKDDFVCNMIEDGLRRGFFCDTQIPFEIHFKPQAIHLTESLIECGHDSIPVSLNDSYQPVKGKNVILIYWQSQQEMGIITSSFMTYCAGTRLDGSFEWDTSTGHFKNWSVVTATE